MLVLTRRENEKVLFPNLGISVEIVRVKGKAVRLGIDAPRDVRAVRGELDVYQEDRAVVENTRERKKSIYNADDVQRNLDAANLAIHLAQNQLRQGISENAEVALEHAVECLQTLETLLDSSKANSVTAVRERPTGYSLSSDTSRPVAIVVVTNRVDNRELVIDLEQSGYEVFVFSDSIQAIEYLATHPQPQIVLSQVSEDEPNKIETDDSAFSAALEIDIPGIRGLQRAISPLTVGEHILQAWFATDRSNEFLGI